MRLFLKQYMLFQQIMKLSPLQLLNKNIIENLYIFYEFVSYSFTEVNIIT